jgi:hypothetical protein
MPDEPPAQTLCFFVHTFRCSWKQLLLHAALLSGNMNTTSLAFYFFRVLLLWGVTGRGMFGRGVLLELTTKT